MTTTTLLRCTGIIFAIVAAAQLVRFIFRWEASVAGQTIPLWGSGLAVLIAGYLAYESLRKKTAHYACTGSCKGVSSAPGVCQAETCEKKGMPLTECSV